MENTPATPEAVSPEAPVLKKVYVTKKPKEDGAWKEITNPSKGNDGWMYMGKDAKGEDTFTKVVYDTGGTGRTQGVRGREMGRFFSMQPCWVTLDELKERKIARSRAWKKSAVGQDTYLQSRPGRYMRSVGNNHPHDTDGDDDDRPLFTD